MTRNKFFNNLDCKDLKLPIDLGDDGRYSIKGISTVTFKRGSGSHLHLNNLMYVSSLNKNIDYVAVLEDKGYDVVFSRGKAYLKHVSI